MSRTNHRADAKIMTDDKGREVVHATDQLGFRRRLFHGDVLVTRDGATFRVKDPFPRKGQLLLNTSSGDVEVGVGRIYEMQSGHVMLFRDEEHIEQLYRSATKRFPQDDSVEWSTAVDNIVKTFKSNGLAR